MKIEIKSVTKGEFDLIETNEPQPFYRRYAESSKGFKIVRYEHLVGDGWLEYRFTEFLEEAYEIWEKEHPDGHQRNSNEFTNT